MSTRPVELGRAAWGTALIVAPRVVLRVTGGDPGDRASVLVMRALGVRQAAQAALSGLSPSPPVLALGVWVDAAHATSAFGFAVVRRRFARPALVEALIASGWAAIGLHDVRSGAQAGTEGARTRLARRVLVVVPGGAALLRQA